MESLLLVLLAFVCGLGLERYVLRPDRPDAAEPESPISDAEAFSEGSVSNPESPAAEEGASAPTDGGDGENVDVLPVYTAAARLEPFYDEAAHPGDLEGHEAFCAGVELLRGTHVDVRRLLWYAAGDNAEISVMALAALRGHPDLHTVANDLVDALRSMGGWGRYFALQVLGGTDPRVAGACHSPAAVLGRPSRRV